MAFTMGSTLAKDSGGTAIAGGLLSADIAGGGVGPTILFHGMVDGLAGSNRAQVTAGNALKVDASSVAVPITDNSGSLTVDNAGTFAVQDSRFATEDAAASADPVGPVLLAVRRDTLSTSEVSADGDNIALKATSKGKLHVASEVRLGDTVADTGSGTGGSATQRIILDSSQLGSLGQAAKSASAPVVPSTDWVYNTGKYVAVAASQTDSVIQASAGAAGDYLDHVVVVPATTGPGVVTIKDNATALISYPGGGTTALLTLTPFVIYVGAISSSGAWKITTGSNVSVLAVGRFS